MNTKCPFRKIRRAILFQLLCLVVVVSCSLSQNNHVNWWSFNMGFAKSQTPGTVVKSVAGQSFVGKSQQPGTLLISGFLADTLLRAFPVSVPEQEGLPATYSLDQNYPNPFNPSTTIRYELPSSSHVRISVFNVLGQVIATLVDEVQDAGYKSVVWKAGNVASGVYFYRLQSASFVQTRKMLLQR